MWKVCSCTLLASLILWSCNANTAGRHYTHAKLDRFNNLIPARELLKLEDGKTRPSSTAPGNLDKLVDRYFGLTLDAGYIRYLQSVDRPEVAVFSKVTVRKPEEAGEEAGFVFQTVYLSSETDDSHIEINKDTSFPRADIELLPPFEYDGEILTVELRVIEIDSDDSERVKQLVNLAATTASAGAPESAAAISVFQTVLTFFSNNNRDDIEFAFDFQLASG